MDVVCLGFAITLRLVLLSLLHSRRILLVGEPESCIVQKKCLHPKGKWQDFCILIVKVVLGMKPLYSNATKLHFEEKNHFYGVYVKLSKLS